MNEALVLYHAGYCPFCIKVRQYLKQKKYAVAEKDTSLDQDARNELRAIGGKTQVPCLVINGNALYESDDIIKWFEENGPKYFN